MGGQQHIRTAIATSTFLTIGLAAAVAIGAVPQVASDTAAVQHHAIVRPHVAHVAHVAHVVHVVHGSAHVRRATLTPVAFVLPAAVSVTTASASVPNKHHHKKHHHKKRHHKPAAPKLAPRVTPSASAVAAAISGLKSYVHTILTPTSSQVAQFGDEVCTAFDKNESFAHIKAVILQKVSQLPFTTVSPGADDYVVKTAVKLYCPGYLSRVS